MKKLHAGSLRSYYTIQGVRLQFRCHTLPGVPQPCILLASTEEFRRLFGFGYTFRAAIGHRNSSLRPEAQTHVFFEGPWITFAAIGHVTACHGTVDLDATDCCGQLIIRGDERHRTA